MFAQLLREARVSWDETLTGSILETWENLLLMLRDVKSLAIPRCLYCNQANTIHSTKLVRFRNTLSKAYTAMVYQRLESKSHNTNVKFVADKTGVALVGGTAILRLELLSALLLSKLIASVHTPLEPELLLENHVCFSRSKVVLFWIQGINHEWKQFVKNRANTMQAMLSHYTGNTA